MLRKSPLGIAINSLGEIAVTSYGDGIIILYHSGSFKCILKDAPKNIKDIASTPDDRFVMEGDKAILSYDNNGHRTSTNLIRNIKKNKHVSPKVIASDSKGHIIIGLDSHVISMHTADGALVKQFDTGSRPLSIAVTSKCQLAISFADNYVALLDYDGNKIKDLETPPDVKKWFPVYICCSTSHEIFVENYGAPKAIYKYTSDGEYIGCVTTEVSVPFGIALTEDGQELHIAEYTDCVIKVFKRP